MSASQRVGLIILDGWGYRDDPADNAVLQAKTPVFDRLWAACPHTLLRTDGPHVGLPDGQFGNSEVGHMNLGAGRIVLQDLPRIDQALAGDVADLLAATESSAGFIAALKAGTGRCHLMGLLSPGGVHAHQRHIAALAKGLAAHGLQVVVHAFTDGRDTPPRAGADYMQAFLDDLAGADGIGIGTVCGRYFAMDRDKRWERVERAFDALVNGQGERAGDPMTAIMSAHARDEGDEFIAPTVIGDYAGFAVGDGVVCANFRADRVREILAALLQPGFDGFDRGAYDPDRPALGMVAYGGGLEGRVPCLFPPQELRAILGEVIAEAGLRQFRLAETEKYPHVTYFFNGGADAPFDGEERSLVPSPKVATYDLQPEMSAPEVGERLVAALGDPAYAFVLCNFANPDMVGHTGSLEAAIKAVETVDQCLGAAVEAASRAGIPLLITADHGNCDVMRDPATGGPHTAHTTNPVPLLLVGGADGASLRDGGVLADVAPSVLAMLGLAQPSAMTGRSLLEG